MTHHHSPNPLTTPYEASLSTEAALRSHKSTQRTIDIFFYVYTASLLSGICAIVLEIWGVTLTAWRMEEEPKFPANWKKMHHNPIRLTCLGVELSWLSFNILWCFFNIDIAHKSRQSEYRFANTVYDLGTCALVFAFSALAIDEVYSNRQFCKDYMWHIVDTCESLIYEMAIVNMCALGLIIIVGALHIFLLLHRLCCRLPIDGERSPSASPHKEPCYISKGNLQPATTLDPQSQPISLSHAPFSDHVHIPLVSRVFPMTSTDQIQLATEPQKERAVSLPDMSKYPMTSRSPGRRHRSE
ncbi:hypothetical protein K432DRAFT_397981 [Lepidopterella palustris CBS 459.81]|uniref:Uncharacterized protein n=1 Tax=Lepidopterella palustris CBS 459.81 TaxID=1314670 RepID=A0A8E2DZM2_9PEZI|nr:hypothetical protein K432DRAFT_397981 [Lepidopterella palustris CBS 459.81]